MKTEKNENSLEKMRNSEKEMDFLFDKMRNFEKLKCEKRETQPIFHPIFRFLLF